ncbi:hypothetical protein [Salegentibacter sp. Hel_I_6]|uniref:hypothetical protein n=1 Tax=Salegentibacter sp. Hel_I_6 TaxID=1250278 RepID=UPI00055D7531|nr:hypothetical protein [Salegentibacter sp. Hel_I_6]
MKNKGITYLILTTILLVLVAALAYFNTDFPLVFYLTFFGQILFIFTVYKVLTDNYSTKKTFEDWYEDYPDKKE